MKSILRLALLLATPLAVGSTAVHAASEKGTACDAFTAFNSLTGKWTGTVTEKA